MTVPYLMAKSYPHKVINFLRPPEPDQYMQCLSPYYLPVPNSTKFHINTENPRQRANSTAQLSSKFHNVRHCAACLPSCLLLLMCALACSAGEERWRVDTRNTTIDGILTLSLEICDTPQHYAIVACLFH